MSGIPTQSDKVVSFADAKLAKGSYKIQIPWKRARSFIFFGLSLGTIALGVWLMFDILSANGLNVIETGLLVLYSLTFSWITFAFWNGLIGFVLQVFRIDPLGLRRQRPRPDSTRRRPKSRTAVVMPVYNEDTRRIMAGFEACLRSLDATGQIAHFDFYMLSDTRDPALIDAEISAWQGLCERLGETANRVFYRRRENNVSKKVGNLADFCQKWGSYYECMIVLDADSVMTGECMLHLTHAMEDNPGAGLIQTVPIPVRQETFFGRFIQFAATLYSPMLATGLAFWQTNAANYWGHNAIIRISAFMDNCGLPLLPGKGPFGGEILSHDFVEAALLRRGGWDVFLLPDLQGSYEEVPSNLLDYATRDRRWVQGNIQHLGLLLYSGWHGSSRLHFIFGAVAYLSTVIWLAMLALSTLDAIWRALTSNVFFHSVYQLFPNWPVAKDGLIYSVFYLTVTLLFLPKLLGIVVGMLQNRAAFGGLKKMTLGAVVETLFAILIAPIMMVFHSWFVVSVFAGRGVSWEAQPRDGRLVPWGDALGRTALATVLASAWGATAWFLAPTFFWWLLPVLIGLTLAAPIVRYSSSERLGSVVRQLGIFATPNEIEEEVVLRDLRKGLHNGQSAKRRTSFTRMLPARWREMPVQSFEAGVVRRSHA